MLPTTIPAGISPNPGPGPRISPATAAAIAAAKAPATHTSYQRGWDAYLLWTLDSSPSRHPADPDAIAAYLAHLAGAGQSIATLRCRRAAIAYRFAIARHNPNPAHDPTVAEALKGLARSGRAQSQALPLTSDIQAAIIATAPTPRRGRGGHTETAPTARRRAALDIAIIRTMRDALLRRSEAAALVWSDLAPNPDGSGRLTIRRSKTDQEGEGAVQYLSPATMQALAAIRPAAAAGDDPIFAGLSGRDLSERIRRAGETAGYPGLSGHSPRVGMAQDLAAGGAEMPALMQAGRWQSDRMPARYIRKQSAGRGAVAQYYQRQS